MIIPSIDLMDGNAVQLVEGREKVIDAGDPRPIAEQFALVGEVAVIDLDAALGTGDNRAVILDLIKIAPCRVGGGIRDARTAIEWLDAGARKVILGTAAQTQILKKIPRERVIAAVDARDNRVVVEGWTKPTHATIEERLDELREHVSGFLVTFIEREGRMTGLPLERIRDLVKRAAPASLTVAGGVSNPQDIAGADQAGADTQVGMALYSRAFDLASGFCSPLRSDRADGLWPTIVTDDRGVALGLVYSSPQSVRESLRTRRGVYHSRSRGGLWTKGQTSGNTQELLAITADCDRDALRFTVRQHGAGFCHTGAATCFGEQRGLAALEHTIIDRIENAQIESFTKRLINDELLLRSKILEEAHEMTEAKTPEDAAWEAADVFYFTLVAAARRGASLAQIEQILDDRALKITRRSGQANQTAEIESR